MVERGGREVTGNPVGSGKRATLHLSLIGRALWRGMREFLRSTVRPDHGRIEAPIVRISIAESWKCANIPAILLQSARQRIAVCIYIAHSCLCAERDSMGSGTSGGNPKPPHSVPD
mgnify:FL=1